MSEGEKIFLNSKTVEGEAEGSENGESANFSVGTEGSVTGTVQGRKWRSPFDVYKRICHTKKG